MTRILRSPPAEEQWRAVSEKNPCPICQSVRGLCSGNLDESFVSCSRTPSDWLLTTGSWLHAFPPPAELAGNQDHEPANTGTAPEEEPSLGERIAAFASSLAGSNA